MATDTATRTTPTISPTPTIYPNSDPWHEHHTDPVRICPAQRREAISPDVAP